MTLYICQTVKHLLSSIILVYKNNTFSGTKILICEDHQDLYYELFFFSDLESKGVEIKFINEKKLEDDFKEDNLFNFSSLLSKNLRYQSGKICTSSFFLESKLKEIINLNKDDDVYIFHDMVFISKAFLKYEKLTLIEDGYANYYYRPLDATIFKRMIRFFMGYHPFKTILGEKRSVKKILVTEPDLIPIKLKNKIERINLYKGLEESISSELNKIFKVPELNNCQIIFLTQGIDVAGLCSLKDKLRLYSTIIDKLSLKFKLNICIKIHPSEKIEDYSSFEEKYSIIDSKIPFEILSLNFKEEVKIISLLTSSQTVNNKDNVINLVNDVELWGEFDVNEIIKHTSENIDKLRI